MLEALLTKGIHRVGFLASDACLALREELSLPCPISALPSGWPLTWPWLLATLLLPGAVLGSRHEQCLVLLVGGGYPLREALQVWQSLCVASKELRHVTRFHSLHPVIIPPTGPWVHRESQHGFRSLLLLVISSHLYIP